MGLCMRPLAPLPTAPTGFQFAYGRSQWPTTENELIALQRLRRWVLPSDAVLHLPTLHQIEAGYALADPDVDQLLTERQSLLSVLQRTAQHELDVRLQAQLCQHLPALDHRLAKIGAAAYRRYPLLQIWLLRNVALMAGYSIPALSTPLLATGELVQQALPRLYRTYEFIQAVSRPDALEIGGHTWRMCVQVRELHARVRAGLRPTWNTAYWGEPINQSDMIATHLQFSLLILLGYRGFGAALSDEEQAGILALWQQISTWLGVATDQVPLSTHDALRWLYAYVSTQKLDYSLGRPLAQALHDLPTQILGDHHPIAQWTETVNASITRLFVGDDIADGLGLPKPAVRHGLWAFPPLFFALEKTASSYPPLRQRLSQFAAWRQQRISDWMTQYGQTPTHVGLK